MKPSVLFFYNIIRLFIPETSFFGVKNFILRLAGVKIGKNVRICSSARFLGNAPLTIGDNTWVGIDVLIVAAAAENSPQTKVSIGKNVDIAPRVYIGTGTHIIDIHSPNIAGEGITAAINIGDGCWIGANATILPGVTILEKTIVAAGSLVNKDLEGKSIFGGVPAKFIKKLE